MAMRFSGSGLVHEECGRHPSLAGFLDSSLRGVGQVMFQDNSFTGLIFLAAIACNAPFHAVAAMAGAMAGTAAAMLLGQDRGLIRQGLFGFNGALVGIALPIFLQTGPLLWLCVVVAAAMSTVMQLALMAAFDSWKIPTLTAPFVLTSWCLFLAPAGLARFAPSGAGPMPALPGLSVADGGITLITLGEGLANGIAQVFLQENSLSGVLIALGLLVASRAACLAALAGSLAALLVAAGLGAAEPALRAGLFGFNGVLVAMALATTFLPKGRMVLMLATLAVVATPVVQVAIAAVLGPIGLSALTFPFILLSWMFLFAARAMPALKAGE